MDDIVDILWIIHLKDESAYGLKIWLSIHGLRWILFGQLIQLWVHMITIRMTRMISSNLNRWRRWVNSIPYNPWSASPSDTVNLVINSGRSFLTLSMEVRNPFDYGVSLKSYNPPEAKKGKMVRLLIYVPW